MSRGTLAIGFILLLFGCNAIAKVESLRVSVDWLKAHLHDHNVAVLDARPPLDYTFGHVVGALTFPADLTYQKKSDSGTIVDPVIMQKLLRERGLDNGKQLVVYDSGQLLNAARVLWVLEVYGLKNVKILSPGYATWVKQGFPVNGHIPKVNKSKYVITIDHRRIASKFSMQLATVNPEHVIVDARLAAAYQGETSTAKRFGHIPTAINIPVTNNFQKNGDARALRDSAELAVVYATLPRDNKIVLYCEIGRASSVSYLVLRELGYDVSSYDASWREWGNDLSLPIEK